MRIEPNWINRLCFAIALMLTSASSAEPADSTVRYQQMLHVYGNMPAVQSFDKRLGHIESLQQRLIETLEYNRKQTLQKALDDNAGQFGLPQQKQPKAEDPPPSTIELHRIAVQTFSQPLATEGLSQEQLDLMTTIYRERIEVASSRVWMKARATLVGDEATKIDALRAGLIIPMVFTGDRSWEDRHTAAIPEWVRDPEYARRAEQIALGFGRPHTAYSLSRASSINDPAPPRSEFINYLRDTALNATKNDQHSVFLGCMREAIEIARDGSMSDRADELSFQLAEGLGRMEQHAQAADAVRSVMEREAVGEETYVKALLLRLKYLYDGESYEKIVEELPILREDERCKGSLPRIDYTLWVAHRRLGNQNKANQLQKAFLKAYPEHVLGADMYFSKAMSALASGDTAEAQRLLDVIRFEYPESRLIPRIQEIQKRIDGVERN